MAKKGQILDRFDPDIGLDRSFDADVE